jgi:hypothetical protein
MKKMFLTACMLGGVSCASDPVASNVIGGETNKLDECTDAPEVDLEEVDGAQPKTSDVLVSAYVYLDEECETISLVGIKLYYQQSTAGSESWEEDSRTPGQNPDEWRGTIPSHALGSAYMRYYVMASDSAGNITVVPDGADTDTLKASTFNVSTQ